jgi:hypothetical protein
VRGRLRAFSLVGYALDTFAGRWHQIINDALAHWRGELRDDAAFDDRRRRLARTADLLFEVIGSAN